jgi:hypothetical protein
VDQPGFFHMPHRLRDLSSKGDDIEPFAALAGFAQLQPGLKRSVARSDGSNCGRPAFDHLLMLNSCCSPLCTIRT